MIRYFATCISRSRIAPELDFLETRFVEILDVTSEGVELVLLKNQKLGMYIKPGEPQGTGAVRITFDQFESVLCPSTGEVLVSDETVSQVYLKAIEEYNPKFNYVYTRRPVHLR